MCAYYVTVLVDDVALCCSTSHAFFFCLAFSDRVLYDPPKHGLVLVKDELQFRKLK